MRNANNASITTVRGSVYFTDQQMRRFVSLTMERLAGLQESRGLGKTELEIKEQIEGARRAQPGIF